MKLDSEEGSVQISAGALRLTSKHTAISYVYNYEFY